MRTVGAIALFVFAALQFAFAAVAVVLYASEGASEPARAWGGIVISFSLGLPAYVAAEAGLSYLGIGVFGRESWGRTIAEATQWWDRSPLFLLEPVIGIALLCVALNLLGDALRDAFDPKTRR